MVLGGADLPVPSAEFAAAGVPASRRQSTPRPVPAPGGRPDPAPPEEDPAVTTFEWIALRRALRGGLSTRAGRYDHRGRPVLREMAGVLDRLIQTGSLVLGAPRPGGRQTVHVTVAGYVRYTELIQPAHPWPEAGREGLAV